jgi:hypothetical protein
MQDKRAKEARKAQEHRIRLADKKSKRRSEPVLERGKPFRSERLTMLIYCEGENTEPSYFSKFRSTSLTIKSFGEGRNTLSLVRRANQINKQSQFDRIWCVFDADPKPDNPRQLSNFNSAVRMAEKLGFGVAYSNQAFEYWLILHYEDHQGGALHRDLYGEKLNSYLNPYGIHYDADGDKEVTKQLFDNLMEVCTNDRKGRPLRRVDLAIRRATNIYNRLMHRSPGKEESSTTVFKLVNEIFDNL